MCEYGTSTSCKKAKEKDLKMWKTETNCCIYYIPFPIYPQKLSFGNVNDVMISASWSCGKLAS